MVQLLIVVRSKPGHFVHEAMLKGSNAFVSGFTIFGTTVFGSSAPAATPFPAPSPSRNVPTASCTAASASTSTAFTA